LCCGRRSVGQSVLEWSTHLGLTTTFLLLWDSCRFVDLSALSDERTGLSFTISAGPLQRSHSRVRGLWDSRPYFTVSDSRLSGLRWRYSTPPPHRIVTKLKVKVTFRLTVSQSVFPLNFIPLITLPYWPRRKHRSSKL
jgi:hypothetical protein